ncbi:MAG: cobalt transporter [Alphaproteobacteria bacterium]|nr:cobalt transporter [Alphaproteobacteria bacterium]
MTTHASSLPLSFSQRMSAGLTMIFIGLGILYVVGFAPMAAAHNAAHDTRHAIGFPCH